MGKIPATKQDVETTVENAVDKLALMINESFKSTATKDDIKAVTTRLDGIDLRLDTLDGSTHSMPGWEESRQTSICCAMRWYTGRNFMTRLTASSISRRSSALRAASNARRAPFPLPHRPGVDNQGLDERRTWCMLKKRYGQRNETPLSEQKG
jgi:hypothetical protein